MRASESLTLCITHVDADGCARFGVIVDGLLEGEFDTKHGALLFLIERAYGGSRGRRGEVDDSE